MVTQSWDVCLPASGKRSILALQFPSHNGAVMANLAIGRVNNEVRLTSLASCAGCAAKLHAGTLAQVLRPLSEASKAVDYPALLVGLEAPDDAAVYKLNDEQAVIST